MQLTPPRRLGRLAAGLSVLSANLLAANAAQADGGIATSDAPAGLMDELAPGPASVVLDSSVLFYQESGERVRAIEPVINGQINLEGGDVITLGVTYDTLTGATPNGAVKSTGSQTFNSVVRIASSQTTTTSASGTVTPISGTSYADSSYTVAAGKLPTASFHDHRVATNLGYAFQLGADTKLKTGAAFSIERDYTTFSANLGLSRDFNQKNTTLTLGANIERDISRPFNDTPLGFQKLNSQISSGNDQKTELGVLAGITQTLARFWLTQLNYGFTMDKGYQSDPYRILSVVDTVTGAPIADGYLYENRPRDRKRQSVYWGNKLALGPTVADVSLRYYHDNWGINAITAEISEQVPITRYIYAKPLFRYYHQGAASFYRPYLLNGAALPQYASSDSRLARFNAVTYGGKAGWRFMEDSELYVEGEVYRQNGSHIDPTAPGALAGIDTFSGVHAFAIMTGFRIRM